MGVRCTLFGHAYGDSEIERDRDERGEEAVVTIREVQECARCGTRTVVSENKEVTSVAPREGAPPTSEPEPAEPTEPDDAPTIDERARDPETDDGVILEDEAEPEEPGERQYGEWPDAEDREPPADEPAPTPEEGQAAWPDAEGDDEGFDARSPPAGEDAEAPGLAEAERADAAADADAPGAAGDAATTGADAESEDVEFVDADDSGAGEAAGGSSSGASTPDDTGIQREREAQTPAEPGRAGSELHCPACGYRDDSTDGSLREGDVCPECKGGYLAARD